MIEAQYLHISWSNRQFQNHQGLVLMSYYSSREPMKTHQRISRLIAAIMVIIVLVIYQALYALSFFPITEGWFSEYGILIRSGKVPYRDFPFLMTPLYPALVAVVQIIFGEGFLPLRIIGVVVTTGIGLCLWMILCEFFNPWPSAFGAVVANIYYQSGVAYIGYDFTQVVTLFLLLGAYCMILDIGATVSIRSRSLMNPAFFAGLFLSAAVMIKQSNGGVAALVLSIFYTFITVRVHDKKQWTVRLLHFLLGLFSVTGIGIFIIALNGALGEFFQQVVLDAIRAKGGTSKIFTAWISGIMTSPSLIAQAHELFVDVAVIMAITGPPYILFQIMRHRIKGPINIKASVGVFGILTSIAGLLMVAALVFQLRYRGLIFSIEIRDQGALVYNNVILMSLVVYLVGTIITTGYLMFRVSAGAGKMLMLFSFGLALMVANGTSAGLSEISSFVGLGVAISFLMTLSAPFIIPSIVPIGISLLLLSFLVEKKYEMPYAWWSITTQDVRKPLMRIENHKILGDICMEKEKFDNLESIVSIIREKTAPEDRLYVFPHMPVFNMMSSRLPYENIVVSWFDFMSERAGEKLLENLGRNPPKALVIARLKEDVYLAHERLFNNNKPCVQRKVIKVIDALVGDGR
ncbi:MAG TPA: hypothetical protein VN374_04940, partial [Desulfitobacteriaceae bacterium]|nr:hypothetical protein [Desulfitobacteriaceae bacterium]